MGHSTRTGESGQAVVEAALTLPLMVFILLGTVQLFMMMHGRILTQLAAFQATRAGSLNHGNCERMVHAALLQVLPAIEPFARPSGGLSQNVADAFDRVKGNSYLGKNVNLGTGRSIAYSGTVIWIVRTIAGRVASTGGDDDDFDQSVNPMRLETQLVFWFPMRVPFANWIIGRAVLAHFGIQAYSAQNPLLISQQAAWTQRTPNSLSAEIRSELGGRMLRGEFVFPIVATSTMRMMTPLRDVNRVPKNCPPTPQSL